MGIAIPMLDLMFFLTENQGHRGTGAALIFQGPRRGGAAVVPNRRRVPKCGSVPPFNRIPVLFGRPAEWRGGTTAST
jgi:hypothetical protein